MPKDLWVLLQPDQLRSFIQRLYEVVCVPSEHAFVVADSLVNADLRGHPSHGVQRTLNYLDRVRTGSIDAEAKGYVIQETEGSAVWDGQMGFGQVVSYHAMKYCIEKARGRGIAAVSVRRSNHFGTCGYWAMMALPENMIGFASTHTAPLMPPYGGSSCRIGNNPWAFAMPAKKETPIVLDMSQACASVGKLQIAAKKGEKIPFGWATDNYGNPTDDPNKVLGGKGMYLPIGTYKGFGQAVIVEVLCGLLGGMAWNSMHGLMDEIDQPANVGHFFFAIDIDAFTDIEQFKELVDHLIQSIKDTPLAAGFERVYSPGEPETEAEHRYKTAVPILLNTLDELNQAAATFKLSDRLTPLLNTR